MTPEQWVELSSIAEAVRDQNASVRKLRPANRVPDPSFMFRRVGPYVTSVDAGREPSLQWIIEHYYASHGCSDAVRLAREYVEAWLRESTSTKESK